MSESHKQSWIIASTITAIIAILIIVFGNTGSGFFKNLMIFIVGVMLGTPLALLAKTIVSFIKDEVVFQYGAFILGAFIGVALASSIFSNKSEIGFMYQCVKTGGISKPVCECIYEKLDDEYEDLEKVLLSKPTQEYLDFVSKSTIECK